MKIKVRLAFGNDSNKIADFCQTSDSPFYRPKHQFVMAQPMSLTFCRYLLKDWLRQTRKSKDLYTRLYVYTYDNNVLVNSMYIPCRCNRSFTFLYKSVAAFSRYSLNFILPF